MWETFGRKTPPNGEYTPQVFARAVKEGKIRPAKISELLCPPPVWTLIEDCWKQKPEERPTMEAVCKRIKQLLIDCKYDSFHNEVLIANKDKVNEQGQSALHIAAQQGDVNMIQVLLKCQVDSTLVDNNGKTALDIAIAQGNEKAIRLLS